MKAETLAARAKSLGPVAAIPEAVLVEEAKELPFAKYRSDPVGFCREVLGLTVWSRQEEILCAVESDWRVAVRSGHKIGKTTSAAALALWFVATRARASVVVTATTYDQVKTVFWKELRRLHLQVRDTLGGKVNLDPSTGLQFEDGRSVVGLSTDKPEGMAGFSSPELLFIVDEASGVAAGIFEAIEGNRAGGARIVMFGNPTRADGVFYDAFHTKREFWRTVHISSEETPNCTGIGDSIPGLATKAYVDEKRADWGVDSPLYQVRIAGNFSAQATNAIISLGDVEAARARWKRVPQPIGTDGGLLELGIDVARFGDDDSVIQPRRGYVALEPIIVHGMDGIQVAGQVMAAVRSLRKPPNGVIERPLVKVDVIGVGASVVDQLKQFAEGPGREIDLVDVNSSSASSEADEYMNLRSQMAFGLAAWLRDGGTFAPDSKLEAELLAPTYGFDNRGRRRAESKDDLKKRLGRSPDRADALALAVCRLGAPAVTLPGIHLADFDSGGILD